MRALSAILIPSILLAAAAVGLSAPGAARADETYRIPPALLEAHKKLVARGSQSVMTISRDGHVGGAYCERGSDAPCGPARLKELALRNCRANGGRYCEVFAINDKILVPYEMIEIPATPSLADRTAALSGSQPAQQAKTPESLALEQALSDWIQAHRPEFQRRLDAQVQATGDLPESGLRVHKVNAVEVAHRQADEYELRVSYVMTRSGLPATSSNYNRPISEYALTKSFPVRFAGGDLSFL